MKRQTLLSRSRSTRSALGPLCAAFALLGSGVAQAQLSPYYFNISERISYDSNVFRVPDTVGKRRDGISLTAVTVGVDQPIGRQRVYGSATATYTAYKNNDQLDSAGYNLVAGLDWEAASKLSGDVRVNFSQAQADLAQYGSALQNFSGKNQERAAIFDLRGQYGGASLLTLEGLANYTDISYSSSLFASRERKSTMLGGGLRYRPSGDWVLGLLLRGTRGEYPRGILTPTGAIADEYDRRDIDLTASYQVTGLSSLDARISSTKEEHDQQAARDFSGVTGEISYLYRATGKLQLGASLARETGSGATLNQFASAPPPGSTTGPTTSDGYLNDARVSDRISLQSIWDASAKIRVTGGLRYSRDSYDSVLVVNNTGTLTTERGNTRGISLAARYAATRVLSFECGAGKESRSADNALSALYDYDVTTAFCSAALALQ